MKHQAIRNIRNVLVTGGAGFIGSAFIRHLLGQPNFSGHVFNVDCLTYAGNTTNLGASMTDERHTLLVCDITDAEHLRAVVPLEEIDAIVHFAAESHVDRSIHAPRAFLQTNVLGTANLLELVRKRPEIHFHHVSTDEVYGSIEQGEFSEESPHRPNSPYAASKSASDMIVRAYANTYGLSTTVSNCSNNYGPYQSHEKFVPTVISRILQGKPIPVYGDGRQERDWLFVEDHVAAILELVRRGRRGETYNVGGRCVINNLRMIQALSEAINEVEGDGRGRFQVEFVTDRPGHDRRYAVNDSKIEGEFGIAPVTRLRDGLRETVRFYASNREWVDAALGRLQMPRLPWSRAGA